MYNVSCIVCCIFHSDERVGATEGRYWTSGIQIEGAIEPDQGFIWSYSGQPISTDLWLGDEPNDTPLNQSLVQLHFHHAYGPELVGLYDASETPTRSFICEYRLL